MKLIFSTLLIALSTLGYSQVNQVDNNGERHGKWIKYYPESEEKLRYEGRFDHGIPVGKFTFYHENGQIQFINTFRGKTNICYSKQFDNEGHFLAEGLYNNQLKDSTWTYYGMNNELLSREDFQNNEYNGFVIVYYKEGGLAEKTEYVKGVKNGIWLEKYEDGKPKAKGTYKNGQLHGEVIYYNQSGKPFYKGKYHNGLRHGVWYTFEDGKVIKKETFEKGILRSEEEY